jgi:hypothetical protein
MVISCLSDDNIATIMKKVSRWYDVDGETKAILVTSVLAARFTAQKA